MYKVIAIALLSSALALQSAAAAVSGDHARADYPGNLTGKPGIVCVAQHIMGRSITAYYQLMGRWPVSWQEVVDAKLCQVTLRTSDGQAIDPDDKQLDFSEDIYYDYRSGEEPPQLIASYDLAGHTVMRFPFDANGMSIRAGLEQLPAVDPQGGWEPYVNRPQVLLEHVVDSMFYRDMTFYRDVHGHFPSSFAELLDSGVCPFDRTSLNPLSGQAFLDGAVPFGLTIARLDSASEPNREPQLQMYDELGQPVPLIGAR